MKVIHPPRSLILSAVALFSLVPVSVITAAVFSKRAWWDLSMSHLKVSGWVSLGFVALSAWRLAMGRRGAWEVLAWACGLSCTLLLFRSALNRDTLQALWSVGVSALCFSLMVWTKRESSKSYFDPGILWFQGLPQPIPELKLRLLDEPSPRSPLRVCRLDHEGLFAFSTEGKITPNVQVHLELYHRDPLDERKVRIQGRVVRQFESRVSEGKSSDWGIGVRFDRMSPDLEKDFKDFLEVLRGEGYIFG